MSKFHKALAALLFTAVMSALAPGALAVDGTVLINQSTSVNGLPGCQHSGFPIQICQPGSYRLSGSITVSDTNTDAIDIAASDVSLDLNGFRIVGPCSASRACVGNGVQAPETGNISVFNGTVRGFNFGIYIGKNSHVEKVQALDNHLIGIDVDSGSIVTGSVANDNGGVGISVTNGTINNNTANNNGEYGIQAQCPSSIVGNTMAGNAFSALVTIGSCVDANNSY